MSNLSACHNCPHATANRTGWRSGPIHCTADAPRRRIEVMATGACPDGRFAAPADGGAAAAGPPPGPEAERARGGAGTELRKLFRAMLIKAGDCLACGLHAAEMDQRGIEWCEAHVDTIVGWLREAASKRPLLKWVYTDTAARALVRQAIENAKGAQADGSTAA